MSAASRIRYLVELQGYLGLCDRTVAEIDPWLRVAPALCATWALTATAAASATGFSLLAGIALAGAVFPWHPFDIPYTFLLRHRLGTAAIPPSPTPRRFACAVATIWLIITAGAVESGVPSLGTVLGIAFASVAFVPVISGLCVPSWILRHLGYSRSCRTACTDHSMEKHGSTDLM
jgi:uncharacterized protein DUF4395